ncbi:MAG: cyclic-di-GMP-binding protein, partial [Mucilaginibacter sp.]|nr:cyclic-di-GMP-binding protein [Mucilaginibacter sp.]
KKIKDSGLKVQASIMDDQVRVQGKKIDDLQTVISLCRGDDFGQPLQYINMRD